MRLSCLDDDAQGTPLEVLWEKEVDAIHVSDDLTETLAAKTFADRAFKATLQGLER